MLKNVRLVHGAMAAALVLAGCGSKSGSNVAEAAATQAIAVKGPDLQKKFCAAMTPPPAPKVDPDPVKAAQQPPPAAAQTIDNAVFAVLGPTGAFQDWIGVGMFSVEKEGVGVSFMPCGQTNYLPEVPYLGPLITTDAAPAFDVAPLIPLSSPQAAAIGKAIAASKTVCDPHCDERPDQLKPIYVKISGVVVPAKKDFVNQDGRPIASFQHFVGVMPPFYYLGYGNPQFYANFTKVELQ